MNERYLLLIDRVACGTATIEDEQTLLVACETQPELYRSLALAILEERHFAIALGHSIVATGMHDLPAEPSQTNDAAVTRSFDSALQPTRKGSSWKLAIAALVIGVTVGFASGWFGHQAGLEGEFDPSHRIALHSDAPERGMQSSDEAVSSRDQAFAANSRSVLASGLTAAVLPRSVIPDELRQGLRDAGFQVEESPEFYWVSDTDGSQWLVPSQATTVRYDVSR